MAKISEIFSLNKSQYELDFVDVDIEKDSRLFLDPFFISTRNDPWSVDTSRTIKSFFQYVIELIRIGKKEEARSYFIHLNEPNETCMGMSLNKPRGNGMGDDNASKLFDSLLSSKAVESGLVEDLEDSAIFIDGIGRDKVSDATTNIVRMNLLQYTINQCNLWGIPLSNNVSSGFYWGVQNKKWSQEHISRLIIDHKAYLLVPKIAVTFYKEYTDSKYYRHYVLNFLQEEHLDKNTPLVQTRKLKSGREKKFVTKKDVSKHDAPPSKELLREFTRRHPDIFEEFRQDKKAEVRPLKNEQLTDVDIHDVVEYLVSRLEELSSGNENASKYHKLMLGVLELIFYPNLINPIKEKPINGGCKRIDIVFDNSAKSGYFYRLHNTFQIPSGYVFVECKNYKEDPANPELDQLSGRLSVNRGKFGILVCRTIDDYELMRKRCADLWSQKQELIIPLCDNDIVALLKSLVSPSTSVDNIMNNKQRDIVVS